MAQVGTNVIFSLVPTSLHHFLVGTLVAAQLKIFYITLIITQLYFKNIDELEINDLKHCIFKIS